MSITFIRNIDGNEFLHIDAIILNDMHRVRLNRHQISLQTGMLLKSRMIRK